MSAAEQAFAVLQDSRRNKKAFSAAFAVLAVLAVFLVFRWLTLTGITLTDEAFCGQKDHQHSELCYEQVTTCELAENEDHKHTADCFSSVLVCEQPEHTHTALCYPDYAADAETYEERIASFASAELSERTEENLINIAFTQLGYTESERNFILDENSLKKKGYTRYGAWFGNEYANWNTLFVSFCLYYSQPPAADSYICITAEGMKSAFSANGLYLSAKQAVAERGDVVFFDTDSDGISDRTAIVIFAGTNRLIVLQGDCENRVQEQHYTDLSNVLGYGRIALTTAPEEEEEEEEKEEPLTREPSSDATALPVAPALPVTDDNLITGSFMTPHLSMSATQEIVYGNDLTDFITGVTIRDINDNVIQDGDMVYIGQQYKISIAFSEINTQDPWLQFKYGEDDHELSYHIPLSFHCEEFGEWEAITTTRNGTVETVGQYIVHSNGLLEVVFFDDENGVNFIDKYTNTHFNITFEATVGSAESGSSEFIDFGNEININLNIDGNAAYTVDKTHGLYNRATNEMEYTIRVQATQGVVKDLVVHDRIWENHYDDPDSIVVTDLDGNVLDPQPTLSAPDWTGDVGFKLSDFPDFSAGEGYLIKYAAKINDNILANNPKEVGCWNGVDTTAKNSKGDDLSGSDEDWAQIDLHNLTKEGNMITIQDENGDPVNVLEWVVREGDGNSLIDEAIIIDTLGDGLTYYTGEPVYCRVTQPDGTYITHYIEWDDITVTGSSMSFDLPAGVEYKIVYYTTYDPLQAGEESKVYQNTVKTVINGRENETTGSGIVVGFKPEVSKAASGEDGEYVYFEITATVPGSIAGMGNFHFTDLAAFWGYDNGSDVYVENFPLDMEVTATLDNGTVVTFTPYVEGGNTEHTYILVSPAKENNNSKYHSFTMYFNTDTATAASSQWLHHNDALLKVRYKLPFSAKTGSAWYGDTASGPRTLGDILLAGGTMANAVYFNFTQDIYTDTEAYYEYNPMLLKDSTVNPDGTIDYTVVFNNTVPGSGGDDGYLNATTATAYFTDTFDERLEYVEGSMKVVCYDPWRDWLWLNEYYYDGSVDGNSMHIAASDFVKHGNPFNQEATSVGWSESWLSNMADYKTYCNQMDNGGRHVFTYTLKIKDEYLNTTETAKFRFDNTAEMLWGDTSSGPARDHAVFETGLIDKQVVQENDNLHFEIIINERSLDLLAGTDTLTVTDAMTDNLSVYWNTIKLYYDDSGEWESFDDANCPYTYATIFDPDSNTLTFTVPDSLKIKIDYTTLVTETGSVSVGNLVRVEGKAEVSDFIDANFHISDHTGGAGGSLHNVTLLKQDGLTDHPLPDAQFLLYGPYGDSSAQLPDGASATLAVSDTETLRFIGAYTTGEDGTAFIESQYLALGGPYALVEWVAPAGYNKLTEPTYFYYYSQDPDGVMQTVTTLVTVQNFNGGYILPETGGIGTLPFTLGGAFLMAGAAAALVFIDRRNKKKKQQLTHA